MKIRRLLLLVLAAGLAAASRSTVSAEDADRAADPVAEEQTASPDGVEATTEGVPRLTATRAVVTPAGASAAAGSSGRAETSGGMIVGWAVAHDESPALRDLKPEPVTPMAEEQEANENPGLPFTHVDRPDPVIEGPLGTGPDLPTPTMPSPILNFDGILFPGVACNCAPPDPNGEVGLTQYVQMVNNGFQVFDKTTGVSTFGPAGISTLWTNFGGVCQNNGHGDPVVLYDQLADRWIISQFAGTTVPTDECIAVSKTGDATGAYYRYDFHLGTDFFDYPHLAVWPDGYYMSMNVFNTAGSAFLGPQAFVFDRAKMLAGLAASFQTPGITGGPNEDVFLPADLDGYSLPPAGAPNSFVETPFTDTYRTWHFHVDWVTPANSTFTLFDAPAAAGFTALCPATRNCIPQLGTANGLDEIGDRLMFRLAYRNIGGTESVVGNYTVDASSVAGIRWFELRGVTAGPVTVFQESTYQPDTTWRWMGSAAMDNLGDLALGFSASSATINPEIRYAGRLWNDPVNSLAQGETTLFAGTGSQTGTPTTNNRWGDYSDLTVDPSDDCTFWYTQEYYSTTANFAWRTRIGNFKFPSCTASQRGTISGTITNCSTLAPIPNAQVTIDGGFGRATDAAGTYSAIVTPGTYNASVTGIGYDTASTTGLVVANGGNATFTTCLNGVAPEIAVSGNGGIDLVDGDSSPSAVDGTDFGVANVTGGTAVRTFTVQNLGAIDLTVGILSLTGPGAADFTVTLAPGTPVAPGGSTTFQITFDPVAAGASTATVSFANNDPDENPFDFSITGYGFNGGATCPKAVLPNDGSTSGNARAPQTRNRFERSVYLITAAELAAAGFPSGATPTTIGWNYQTGGTAGSAPLIVYLQNTTDTTNSKSTTWATAITGMTVVHNATTALPAAAGPFDITLSGGSPFTYTGGGLYVAFDWGQYLGTLGTTTVVWCNTGLGGGLLGAQSNALAPTTLAASSFRPETRLNGNPIPANDVAISTLTSYGFLPLGAVPAQVVRSTVTNNGSSTVTSLPVTLNVTGSDTFTDTQTIPSLAACGGQATVTFAGFTPTAIGSDTVVASVPADDVSSNNSVSHPLDVTALDYSYKYPGTTASGGVGLTGATGAFVGKFTTTAATAVTAVELEFAAASATTYRVAIYGDNSGVPSTSALYVDAANRTVSAAGPVMIALPSPVAVGPGNFYVGIQQTNNTNASLSFDTESPIRSGALYFASPNPPSAWFDLSPGNDFKLNIGVVLAVSPPAIAKAFAPNPIAVGGVSTLSFTITNPNAGTALTGVAFTDSFPAGLQVAATPNVTTTGCGSPTFAPAAGNTSVTFSGGGIAASGTCTATVDVTATTGGAKVNTTGNVSSTNGGTGNTGSDTLTVLAPPAIAKAFSPNPIAVGGISTLSFTITNSNGATALTGVAFTDSFPAGLQVAATPNVTTTGCGSPTFAPAAGNTSLTFSGGAIAASGICTATVDVTATTSGAKLNTTGNVTSTNAGSGNTGSDTLTALAPPSIAKAFAPNPIAVGGVSTLSFTITNPNAGTALTGVAFTDSFPAGLQVAAAPNVTTTGCGAPTFAPAAGNTSVAFSGGTIAASGTCTATVNVTTTTGGSKANTTGNVTSANGGTGNTGSDTLTEASADLAITNSDGVTITVQGNQLVYTIVASNAGPDANPAVTVADTFPAQLGGCSTTSVAAGGATGNDPGPTSGNFSDSAINLPVGATVTYTATCNVVGTAPGSVSTTATIASGAVADPTPGNNSATDTDTIASVSILVDGFELANLSLWSNSLPAFSFAAAYIGATETSVDLAFDFSAAGAAVNLAGPTSLVVAVDAAGRAVFAIEGRRIAPDAPLEVRLLAPGLDKRSAWVQIADGRQLVSLAWRPVPSFGEKGWVSLALDGRLALWLDGVAAEAPARLYLLRSGMAGSK